jgi:hypothetical protein
MGHEVARALGLAAALSAAAAVASEHGAEGIGGGFRASSDSDGLRMERAIAARYLGLAGEGRATAIAVEAGRYSQREWSLPIRAVTLLHRDTDKRTAEGLRLSTSLSRVGPHGLLGLDLDWSREAHPGTRVNVVAGRDWIESRRALEDGLHFDLVGAGLDQELGADLVAVAFYGYQRFSDGNTRVHRRLRFIHSAVPEMGITLQARYREFSSSLESSQGRYFNPRRYSQVHAVVAMRRRLEGGWSLLAEAGAGRQHVSGEPSAPAPLASFSILRAFDKGAYLRARLAYSRSASFGGPDYHYRYAELEGAIPF